MSSSLDAGADADANCTLGLHATTAWLSPTVADNAGSGGPWNIPANAKLQDNKNAWAAVATDSLTTKRLRAHGFNANIPDGSQIQGVTAKIRRRALSLSVRGHSIYLLKSGVTFSDNKADTVNKWDNVYLSKSYGSASDLWGKSWTVDEVNATGFGVAVAAQCTANCSSDQAQVDHIQVQITYRACQ